MNNSQTTLLQPVDDGLPMRQGQKYALAKLKVVELYLNMAMKAVGNSKWRKTFYIDLQAGPGKNNLEGQITLGSPLIALTCEVPFEGYLFSEKDVLLASALKQRIQASERKDRVKILQTDANEAVHTFAAEIDSLDRIYLPGKWPSLNIAFLDPEGLELEWTTIHRLGSINRMDLIINFSTGGLNRTRKIAPEVGDKFFGTNQWRSIVSDDADAAAKRRKWIDFYLDQLTELGYKHQMDDRAEIIAKNSKNVQVYSVIFASKHELGLKLWAEAVKRAQQPRLL